MNTQYLLPLCAAVALLTACGQRDNTQATGTETDSRVEPVQPGDGPGNGTDTTETVPGTTSTPATPATPPADVPPDTATTSPSSDMPPSNPPQGGG
jgi:hypothetical protein